MASNDEHVVLSRLCALSPRSLSLPCQKPYGANVPGIGRTPANFDETTERRWPDPEKGPYRLTLFWRRRNGRPEQVGLQLLPDAGREEEAPVLTTSALRDLKIAEIAAEDREGLPYIAPAPPQPEVVAEGMRPATLRRLTRAADVYQAAWRVGEPPTRAVAMKMNLSESAAANLVRRARLAGLLPPTTGGVPQG